MPHPLNIQIIQPVQKQKMIKLKTKIMKALTNDPFQIVYTGSARKNDYRQCIHHFQSLDFPHKQQILTKMQANLEKHHKKMNTSEILSYLILIDFLSAIYPDPFIFFPHQLTQTCKLKGKSKAIKKQQKKVIGQYNFLYIYLQYLRVKAWTKLQCDSIKCFEQASSYSEKAIQTIKLVLCHDFLFEYNITHSSFPELALIALENILKRISEDLRFLIIFVNEWASIIMKEKGQPAIMVNSIYEQVVYISKQIQKLEALNRLIKGDIKFPKYTLDKDLNEAIQDAMLNRQRQKIVFMSERRLQTQPSEDANLTNERHEEITQSQIICKINI